MPTDPTPTPTPREVLAKWLTVAARHAVTRSAVFAEPMPYDETGEHVIDCEREVLAALAATGDAPLAAEQITKLRTASHFIEPADAGEEFRRVLTAYTTLAAQCAAARAERDKWSAGCVAEMRRNEQFEAERDALRERVQVAEWRAKAATLEAENAWQPVYTAPKTGEHILVGAVGQRPGFGWWGEKWQDWCAVVHYWNNPGEEGFYLSSGAGDADRVTFTHWMPLPPAGGTT